MGLEASVSSGGPDLLGQQLHQQCVVPSFPIGIALGLAHDANGFESDLLIGAYRRDVRLRGVDHDAMVTTLINEVTREQPDRFAAETATVQSRIEVEIDPCMTILGLRLFMELDQARDRAIHEDRQPSGLGLIPGKAIPGCVPPARDLGGCMDAA